MKPTLPPSAAFCAEGESIHPVVVAPTYNNAGTLRSILSRISGQGLPIIVVNDGSTDATASCLNRWRGTDSDDADEVINHHTNRGKAAALMSGFRAAATRGFTHAVTIDTDGQLDPEDIPRLVVAARSEPLALVIGARDDTRTDYPARSRLGRRLSNLAIRLASGARVEDSQCGLRVYPLALLDEVRCRSGRFAFEAEIITRTAWARYPIVNVPVGCRYFSALERVSHFRPAVDSMAGLRLHVRLLLASPGARLSAARRPRTSR